MRTGNTFVQPQSGFKIPHSLVPSKKEKMSGELYKLRSQNNSLKNNIVNVYLFKSV